MDHTAWRVVIFQVAFLLFSRIALAQSDEQYKLGQAVPVSCLNRNEHGEHMTDAAGRLAYSPFPTCSETGKPLELGFGIEKDFNCTIEISDSLFELMQFYVHNDVPMTCRIPARPIAASAAIPPASDPSTPEEDPRYVPMIVGLTGILQFSHLHVSNNLNVLLHAAPKTSDPGVIDAATAYSVSHLTRNTKIIRGDELSLRLSVRWYPNTALPSGWTGVGGHVFLSTLLYCLLSAGGATALCVAYYRGFALPKRLRSHGWERAFGRETVRSNGYAYGVGNGYGYVGPGKTE